MYAQRDTTGFYEERFYGVATNRNKRIDETRGGVLGKLDRGKNAAKRWFYDTTRRIFWPKGVKAGKGRSTGKGAKLFLVVMLTLPIIHWLFFWLYVNINSISMAFRLPSGGWSLHNFDVLFYELTAPDSQIITALKNTFIYFFNNLLIVMPLQLLLSYFYYKKIFMYKTLRVILYMPAIISSVALVSAYKNLVSPTGAFGYILRELGVEHVPELLSDERYATWTIVIYMTWTSIGTGVLLFQGAMARIPVEVLEAARIDGCTTFTEFIRIIIPLISPTIVTQIILAMTGVLSSSGPILLFNGTGTHKTTTLAFWIFYNVLYTGALNSVAATGLFFTVVSVPIILFIRWLLEKIPTVEY